jgi:predicted RNA-binding protein with TRAM domain
VQKKVDDKDTNGECRRGDAWAVQIGACGEDGDGELVTVMGEG